MTAKEQLIITDNSLNEYRKILQNEEKKASTIEKYIRDVKKLRDFAKGQPITQELLINYKQHLQSSNLYTTSSINSYIAAANNFCRTMDAHLLHIKMLRTQHCAFTSIQNELSMQDYTTLIKTAITQNRTQLAMIIETLGSTGIRISELKYVTVESLHTGMASISNKGKIRQILYPQKLIYALLSYCKSKGILSGCVFKTAGGKPLDRSNIWHSMKNLGDSAGIDSAKVYPHNIRHLFARRFYEQTNDIAKLADVLGHSNIETTRIYIKTSGNEHRRLLDGMGMVV